MNIFFISSNGDAAGVPRHVQCLSRNLPDKYNIHLHFLNNGVVVSELMSENNSVSVGEGVYDLFRIRSYWRDLKVLNEKDIDIIHVHSFFGSIYGRILGLISGTRVIYTVHGYSWRGKTFPIGLIAFLIEFFLNLIKKTDTIFVSKHTSTHAKWLPIRGKTTVIYNGSESKARFATDGRSSLCDFRICMVARVDHSKDHNTLSKALSYISSDIEMYLIGSGTDSQHFKDLFSKNLPANVNVVYFGELANPWTMMANSDLVVLVSNFEAFPLTILEAFSLGKPVIASDVGGTSEAFESDIFLVPQKNVSKLVETINFCLSISRSELRQIGENNLKRFNHNFSVETMIRKIDDFYNS